jgi:hypothetical protein
MSFEELVDHASGGRLERRKAEIGKSRRERVGSRRQGESKIEATGTEQTKRA